MDAIIGTNAKVEVQKTLGSPTSVTGLEMNTAGTAVATASNSLSVGDVVVFTVTDGMVQLDGQAVRVASPSGSGFELEGIDISTFDAWSTGTFTKVNSFETLASAQNVTAPNAAPTKLDKTTLIDRSKQYAYGLRDAADGTIKGLFNPGGAAELLVKQATETNSAMVIRCSWNGGTKHTIFNANVSGGEGFDGGTNAVFTADMSFTPIKQMMHYAS